LFKKVCELFFSVIGVIALYNTAVHFYILQEQFYKVVATDSIPVDLEI